VDANPGSATGATVMWLIGVPAWLSFAPGSYLGESYSPLAVSRHKKTPPRQLFVANTRPDRLRFRLPTYPLRENKTAQSRGEGAAK
jgi:hypothetical protein